MVMELLGGSMPAGQPASVATGNRSHVFAIAACGGMNHWISKDGGGPWSGPTQLPNGNLAASVPCAIALPNGSVHVFAIANGGGLTHWSSLDGNTWVHQVEYPCLLGAHFPNDHAVRHLEHPLQDQHSRIHTGSRPDLAAAAGFVRLEKEGVTDLGLIAEEVAETEPLLAYYTTEGKVQGVKYDRIGVVHYQCSERAAGQAGSAGKGDH